MPFPGHARSRTRIGSRSVRTPRRILANVLRTVIEPRRPRPGSPRRRCRGHRRVQRCGDDGVPQADDACVREVASARAALPLRSPWDGVRACGALGAPLSLRPPDTSVTRPLTRCSNRVRCERLRGAAGDARSVVTVGTLGCPVWRPSPGVHWAGLMGHSPMTEAKRKRGPPGPVAVASRRRCSALGEAPQACTPPTGRSDAASVRGAVGMSRAI